MLPMVPPHTALRRQKEICPQISPFCDGRQMRRAAHAPPLVSYHRSNVLLPVSV